MGRDKATLSVPGALGGRTLVEHVVGIVGRRCAPVFVIAARGQSLPALPAQVLRDEKAGVGPLLAVGHGLRAAGTAGAERAFVCAVDMPLLTAELIDTLAGADADVVLPWDGRDHYLAAVYRTGLSTRAESLVAAGQRRMGALINTVDARRMVVSESTPALVNVNTPADLRTLSLPDPNTQ
jgi:molybdopterin-guanine dinucleotide biosynthesis protein A